MLGALQARGVFCRRVRWMSPVTAPRSNPCSLSCDRRCLICIPGRCLIPMFSTVTARELDGPELVADYWVQNLRQPVRFGEVMQTLLASGSSLVLELSPHPVLLPAIEELLSQAGQRGAVLPSLRREQDERATLLGSLASLWCAGLAVAGRSCSRPRRRPSICPPTLGSDSASGSIHRPPKQPNRPRAGHWPSAAWRAAGAVDPARHSPLGTDGGYRRMAWLRDHCVQGAMIFPGLRVSGNGALWWP